MQADSPAIQQFRSWIRSQHLICQGQDFIFETIDHSQLERFEACLNMLELLDTLDWRSNRRKT